MHPIARVTLIIAMTPFLAVPGPSSAQPPDPAAAVFQIEVIRLLPDGLRSGVSRGTGFFVTSDGAALTNSHVVHRALYDPTHYQLMAIIGLPGGAEFYSALIECASRLPYDANQRAPLVHALLGRDVARIRVIPSTLPFSAWVQTLPTGEQERIATAHTGPLPPFPALRIAGEPAAGMHVRMIGYGQSSTPLDKRTLGGEIREFQRASDGTTTFTIDLRGWAGPGYSGSPVLDDQNEVVGLWTWSEGETPGPTLVGDAQSNAELASPCR